MIADVALDVVADVRSFVRSETGEIDRKDRRHILTKTKTKSRQTSNITFHFSYILLFSTLWFALGVARLGDFSP